MATIESLSQKILQQIERESITPNRQTTSGVVSKVNDNGLLIESNGDIQTIDGLMNQTVYNHESSNNTDITYEKNIITNRLNITTDDITINGCKLNPQIYSLSGIVQQTDTCIQGNLNMFGTVLVKSWDRNLQKHVYIRRYIRTPVLYNKMTTAVVDKHFGINTSTEVKAL